MSTITVQKSNIVELDADAVVNAANEGLRPGGGVCGEIFRRAGYERLAAACRAIGHCETGSAVITPGFDLRAKYVIHAVGPIYAGGRHGEVRALYGAYCRALELAVENGCRSVAFPLISAGIFGYPTDQAWEVAIRACRDFLAGHGEYSIDIIFAVLNDRMLELGRRALDGGES